MMDKDLLDGVVIFLAVAEHLSFTHAAGALGLTPTAVSKAIRQLERRHAVMLFQRTTRSVALTEAGSALQRRLRPASEEIGDAFKVLDGYQDRPTGTLRLTMSRAALRLLVEPLLVAYRLACPNVVLDLSVNEGFADLVNGNYDAGIRLGEYIEKDMVAVRLTPEVRWAVVGSPAYFARAGRPATPEELVQHEAVQYRFVTSGQPHRWEFLRDGHEFSVEMKSRLIVNDRASLLRFARLGLGLAYVMELDAADDLAAGRLEPVLQASIPVNSGIYLYFPARMQSQPKLRALIDLATGPRTI
jgi:DNA-binding transcriptional LysR family regulator